MGATNRLGWAAVAALACALPVIAHHSFSAEFESAKTVTLRGTISKVDWVNPHIQWGQSVSEADQLLLADAQTSGGLLIVGEIPGGTVIGELKAAGEFTLVVG